MGGLSSKTGYWTAVATHEHAESEAARNIIAQGFEHYLPRYRLPPARLTKSSHQIVRQVAPLYPSYIFVVVAGRWQSLCSTRGIKRVLMTSGMPSRLPVGTVERIQEREDEFGYVLMDDEYRMRQARNRFKTDQTVRAENGVWTGQSGKFLGMDSTERSRVLFELLGRPVVAVVKTRHLVPA